MAVAIASRAAVSRRPRTSSSHGGQLGQVLLERGPLGIRQGVEGVAAGQHVQLLTQDAHHVTSMQSRILISPSRIRVLTVPRATPSSSATCG